MAQTIELLKNVPITNTITGLETLLTELCEKAALDLDETKQIYIDSLTITGEPILSGIDALTLNGQEISYFSPATHNHDTVYLGINATAVNAQTANNADLLNNQPGSYYLNWNNFLNKPESYSADLIIDGTINKAYTAAEKIKLENIEENADVTDAVNIANSIHTANSKTTPVDADTLPAVDSAAANSLKKITWANVKATLKTYFDTLYPSINIGTTKGDIVGFSASGVPTRVPVGSDGDILMADSSQAEGVVWSPPVDFATTSEVTGVHTTGSITSGTKSMTVASATGIVAGMYVVGEGIAPGTTVSNVVSTTVTLSANVGRTLSSDPVGFYVADKVLSPGLTAGMLCRAWVNFNGEGTVAIRAAVNVSSITDEGTGKYKVNFTTAMPDANYCLVYGVGSRYSNAPIMIFETESYGGSYLASSVRVYTKSGYTSTLHDSLHVNVAIFR